MSNRVTIKPTEFKDVDRDEVTYGVRVYDNYGQAYDNTWDSIPKSNIEILRMVVKSNVDVIQDILDFVRVEQGGIYVGKTWYDWDEIEDVFAEKDA